MGGLKRIQSTARLGAILTARPGVSNAIVMNLVVSARSVVSAWWCQHVYTDYIKAFWNKQCAFFFALLLDDHLENAL